MREERRSFHIQKGSHTHTSFRPARINSLSLDLIFSFLDRGLDENGAPRTTRSQPTGRERTPIAIVVQDFSERQISMQGE